MDLLGRRGTIRSLKMIEPFLSNPNYLDRAFALNTTIHTKLYDVIPYLPNALSDEEPALRYKAAKWLNLFTGQDFGTPPTITSEIANKWREWWEANKSKYPSGGKFDIEVPYFKKSPI